jgi:hypothetical protein
MSVSRLLCAAKNMPQGEAIRDARGSSPREAHKIAISRRKVFAMQHIEFEI